MCYCRKSACLDGGRASIDCSDVRAVHAFWLVIGVGLLFGLSLAYVVVRATQGGAASLTWFDGEGWSAVAVSAMFFGIAGATMLWLRGVGSHRHDPPVARDQVRWFSAVAALFGALWLVRAAAGLGGVFVVCGVLLALSLALTARKRVRRS